MLSMILEIWLLMKEKFVLATTNTILECVLVNSIGIQDIVVIEEVVNLCV
jgi:hypothetical protein